VWHLRIVRRTSVLAVMAMLALVACTASGSTGSVTGEPDGLGTSPSPGIDLLSQAPSSCPKHIPRWLRKNDVVGIARTIVPGNPQLLVACSDSDMGGPVRLAITDAQQVGALADALDRLTLTPAGSVFSCPVSYVPPLEWDLFFVYADGQLLTLRAGGDSCIGVSNGRRFAFLDGRTRRQITGLFS
jgi:hypothetical protein